MERSVEPEDSNANEENTLHADEEMNLYEEGIAALREGRKSMEQGDLDQADLLFQEATGAFEKVISKDPKNIKALGNNGNSLMARAKLNLMVASNLFDAGQSKEAIKLEETAQDMLLASGRLYREILEVDPSQGKAFINWGRVICLRAELAQAANDFDSAYSLFCNAADKFSAGLESIPADSPSAIEACRLAGSALVEAYLCSYSLGTDENNSSLLLEAEELLQDAVTDGPPEMVESARSKLKECRKLIDEMR